MRMLILVDKSQPNFTADFQPELAEIWTKAIQPLKDLHSDINNITNEKTYTDSAKTNLRYIISNLVLLLLFQNLEISQLCVRSVE